MTIVKKSRVVPFTCEQMYNLVNDVEHYDEFLPFFSKSLVHHRDEDEVQATLVIVAAGMSKSFTTRNRLQANKMIEIRLVDGPFSHLEGFWRFDEVPEGCHISFDLEFDFAGRMLSMLLGSVFEQISDKMVDAFCERAKVLYG
ncbi:type II toxin-antitoxin system RatA family toxin [Legionella oakridgensis]|uniref:Oligoketide cyclase/lipid transport protein n=2 Tax=Legionella oakridgensis TaxID=29423 RepID=W0BBL0_9GAMM|nr:type II toxin-antitoxin system RatA family toxin [Legionella oakridgensis]AHE66012.1 oligoketide cyclase/lipid transport protein [Legionella oakridgensis ATCC 33761 = DSM 21215]ETO94244.1 oligoketide cyclase/lipid transport protein [Legionella oakridgensis RV-2-2007]KTD43579.1 oligoketide cyclase/lipid transporter protein [Legionella oakridgensis]STY15938.1 Oligoketide cyclase/lipid transport protein [Legionella longbeachae]